MFLTLKAEQEVTASPGTQIEVCGVSWFTRDADSLFSGSRQPGATDGSGVNDGRLNLLRPRMFPDRFPKDPT